MVVILTSLEVEVAGEYGIFDIITYGLWWVVE